MSTNYYFQVKPSTIKSNEPLLNLQDYLLKQNNTKLHIGMRSAGWRPLFMKTDYYSSIKEIESFYKENKSFLTIIDEYNKVLTWEDLKKELLNWNKNSTNVNLRTFAGLYLDEEGYQFSLHEFS